MGTQMRPTILRFMPVLLFLLHAGSVFCAEDGFYQQYHDLLQAHVTEGLVDYHGFKKDEALLDQFLDKLNLTDPEVLPDRQRLAFYINAYNSYTIKLILDNFNEHGPPSSIKKIGTLFTSPWKLSVARINGKTLSLDAIEHDIIRAQWNEPRIHFAVNCASRSCPSPYFRTLSGGENQCTVGGRHTGISRRQDEELSRGWHAPYKFHI